MSNVIEFRPYGKTPRLFRDIVVTEKIDGTNACVVIEQADPFESQEGWCSAAFVEGVFLKVGAQSRNRVITPEQDNAGFAGWVQRNAGHLATVLGVGYHYGEWWGQGIQRRYALDHKRFSLFNEHRYGKALRSDEAVQLRESGFLTNLDTVPVLYRGPYSEQRIRETVDQLVTQGSVAAPGYMDPEGVITYHSASRQVYKTLIENDHQPKGAAA